MLEAYKVLCSFVLVPCALAVVLLMAAGSVAEWFAKVNKNIKASDKPVKLPGQVATTKKLIGELMVGEVKVKTSVNIETELSEDLSEIVSRRSNGVVVDLSKIVGYTHSRGGGGATPNLQRMSLVLSNEASDELQRMLCHATIEEEAI